MNQLALIDHTQQQQPHGISPDLVHASNFRRAFPVMNIATISSGFEKGDFLVREEKGQRVYVSFGLLLPVFILSITNIHRSTIFNFPV